MQKTLAIPPESVESFLIFRRHDGNIHHNS